MKVHKLATLLVLANLSVTSQAVLASDRGSETVSVVQHSGTPGGRDGSGRQIASVLPLNPTPLTPRPANHLPPKISAKGWKKISVQLPTSVDEAADYCVVTANKVGKVASQKAMELSHWVNTVTRQASNSTSAASSPSYKLLPAKEALQPVEFNNRLWFMPDGRLKTVVQR